MFSMRSFFRFPASRITQWSSLFFLLGLSLACSAGGLVQRAVDTPRPTRALAPTYTATPFDEQILPPIIITPPRGGTPGVIIVPEGIDLSTLLPTPPTPAGTPLPPVVVVDDNVDDTVGDDTVGDDTVGDDDPTAVQLPTQAPPDQATTVPGGGDPGQSTPLPEQTPLPTATPIPTNTPEPTPTPTFTPLPPTPFVVVESGLVSLRTGPSVEYPLVAQLGPRIPIAVTGRNPEGTWYRLCCVNRNDAGNDGTVWVVGNHVQVVNDASNVALIANVNPPPPPTETPPFTPTPTVTPTPTATFVPFDRYLGPQFFPTNNEFLTIWVKLFVGTPSVETPEDPAGGYYLKVFFEGIERDSTNDILPSAEEFYAVSVPGTGYSNLTYNLKYEYRPPDPKSLEPSDPNSQRSRLELIGTGTWEVYVIDGAGNRLSDIVTFSTSPSNPNREVYIAWQRVR